MSQQDFLRSLDADMAAAFADVGLADTGTYTAPGGSAVPCTALIDSDAQSLGDIAQVHGASSRLITLYKAEVGDPVRNAVVVVDSGSYKLVAPTEVDDESRSVWVARRE